MKKYNGIYNRKIKRIIGLILAIILFIFLIPFYLIVSLAIIIDSGFPVFYRAERGGYRGKVFKIFKFRTMVPNADKIGGGTTALNDPRITSIGELLRKTKLDETPQLINIIRGEMSFIGPRPELLRYVEKYDNAEKEILEVRPGITDYSSIKFINLDEIVGNNNADEIYEKNVLGKKNKLRIRYAREVSLIVDIIIFFQTIIKTLKKGFKVILE